MPINVILNGANGKMGLAMLKGLQEAHDIKLVACAGRHDNLSKMISATAAEVVVDFTTPQTVFNNVNLILDSGARPVVGTTGLTLEQIAQLSERCSHLARGAIIAPNFSLAAVLLQKCTALIAPYLRNVEIIEQHHENKLDAPSGTALKTAEIIAQTWQDNLANDDTFSTLTKSSVSQETLTESEKARGYRHQGIALHAVRLPGIVANQEVIFGNLGETLSIRHTTINRDCFLPGLLISIRKVVQLNHLIYGLDNLLNNSLFA